MNSDTAITRAADAKTRARRARSVEVRAVVAMSAPWKVTTSGTPRARAMGIAAGALRAEVRVHEHRLLGGERPAEPGRQPAEALEQAARERGQRGVLGEQDALAAGEIRVACGAEAVAGEDGTVALERPALRRDERLDQGRSSLRKTITAGLPVAPG